MQEVFEVEFIEREIVEATLNQIDIIANPASIGNILDVDIDSPLADHILIYDPVNGTWINKDIGEVIQLRVIYGESATQITTTKFQTSNNYLSGTLKVYLNGLLEINITEDSSNEFSLPIEFVAGDTIRVDYIKE